MDHAAASHRVEGTRGEGDKWGETTLQSSGGEVWEEGDSTGVANTQQQCAHQSRVSVVTNLSVHGSHQS